MRISMTIMLATIAGCETTTHTPIEDTDATTGGAAETSYEADPDGSTADGSSTGGSSTPMDATTSSGATGEDETCGTACDVGEAEVLWIAEPAADLLGGRCLDIVADGQGGAVASLLTDPQSPLAGGIVLSLSDEGEEIGRAELPQRQLEGLERIAPGSFAWVDTTAHSGQSTTSLDDLSGVAVPGNVWAVDDLALVDGGTAYSIVTGSVLPECRIRLGAAGDTEPIGCGGATDRWRLEADGDGVVGGLVGRSALVRVDGAGQIAGIVDHRFQRTLLDLAVAPDGSVWTVGAIGDPDEVGPTFGSFVARHDDGLGQDPLWEGIEDGDTSLVWTAVVIRDGAPILTGRDDADAPRITALTSAGDIAWTLFPELSSDVLLRHADVDPQGHLVVCGERAAATPVIVAVAVP
jgi:hypothetical protein